MSIYNRTPYNSQLKSSALALWGSGLVDASRYFIDGWTFDPTTTTLNKSVFSGTVSTYPSGYSAATSDSSGTAWLIQTDGQGSLVKFTSGFAITAYPLVSGQTYMGVAISPTQGAPYVINAVGSLYAVSGAALVPVTQGFGASPTVGLDASGNVLFSLLPSTVQLGTFTLSSLTSGVSGAIAIPMGTPTCFSVSAAASAVAVGGYNSFSLASGFNYLSVAPNQGTFAGVNSGTGKIVSWTEVNGVWGFSNVVSGLGNPAFVGFGSNTQVFACDPTAGKVFSLTYTLGVLSLSQTLTITKASAVGTTTAGDKALVCQAGNNTLTPLTLSGTWASGATIAIGSPTSIAMTGPSGAVIGCSSGLAFATLSSSGVWSLGTTGAVGFIPGYLSIDSFGNIYAGGSSGANGLFAALTSGLALIASGTFVGSVSGLIYSQGQLLIADAANAIIRTFGGVSWTQQASAAGPTGLDAITMGAVDIFAAGSAITEQFNFDAPYIITPTISGQVSIYHSGAWLSVGLSPSGVPTAITWDPSGNVTMTSSQGNYYSISSGAAIIGMSGITTAPGQIAGSLIGISRLAWLNGHLYGASSLNDSLVEIA